MLSFPAPLQYFPPSAAVAQAPAPSQFFAALGYLFAAVFPSCHFPDAPAPHRLTQVFPIPLFLFLTRFPAILFVQQTFVSVYFPVLLPAVLLPAPADAAAIGQKVLDFFVVA